MKESRIEVFSFHLDSSRGLGLHQCSATMSLEKPKVQPDDDHDDHHPAAEPYRGECRTLLAFKKRGPRLKA